jgi:5-methylcytosine-specific restriction endonuclease McrA
MFCYKHGAYENNRPPRQHNRFYYTSEWKKARKEFLLEHPICVCCGRPAVIVDHVVPIKDGGDPLEPSNLQALCWSCHSRKSIEDGSRYRRKVYSY